MWSAILDRVLRRPLVSVALAGGLLLALAVPALHLHIASPGIDTLPQNLSSVKTYNKLQKAFPGGANSAQVLVKTDDVRTARRSRQQSPPSSARQSLPGSSRHRPTSTTTATARSPLVSIAMQGEGTDAKALAALTRCARQCSSHRRQAQRCRRRRQRADCEREDSNSQMKSAAPLVFAFVLILAFVLMLITFRSIVVAVKAVLLNLLSVAAAYGALVLVFQDGWGKGLLGFSVAPGGVVGFLPIFLFVILFGLSMDYHVFILSRVREAFDRGMSSDDAVAYGIKTTAGVVTSAALVMFGVFSIFATLQFMFLKEFGVGLAIAVLVDATIVRAVLLPATMKLLGDWNWYLPKWLEWLPRLDHGEPTARIDVPPALSPTA